MSKGRITTKSTSNPNEEEGSSIDLRRGPWTLEEDNLLIHYITCNGEGRWNSLAKCAGLKRTGKSCRLRWLNYLKPDIRRGNLTPQEQLLILELHSKWGNRWSKIARHLPGRTDNEIKNYWRTRVQKQARQLNVDSNSKKFLEAIKCFWMPRLLEKMEQSSSLSSSSSISSISTPDNHNSASPSLATNKTPLASSSPLADSKKCSSDSNNSACNNSIEGDSCYHIFSHYQPPEMSAEAMESPDMNFSECQISEADNWFNDDMSAGAFWNTDELWHFRKPEVGI
ncbi:unnamed protein product [Coffea canephora]|uniref:Uncharacterized protein n=1 Tax=Coffea canephora TaxID=49390 RepID=A0A068TWL8_COFCA|nr:unnamed protein product [Coffea canephora]